MPIPPLAREMAPDDVTTVGSMSAEAALIPVAPSPAKDMAPEEFTTTPPPGDDPPISVASIPSPAPVTEMGPDEVTETKFPAVASIPAPSPVTAIAPVEETETMPSL